MARLNHESIAIHVLTCPTYAEAAVASGMSDSTLYRLRQTTKFQEALRKVKNRMYSEALTKAQVFSLGAIEALKGIMDNPCAVDSARVAAARTLLETGMAASELELILSRIDELERRMVDEKENQWSDT